MKSRLVGAEKQLGRQQQIWTMFGRITVRFVLGIGQHIHIKSCELRKGGTSYICLLAQCAQNWCDLFALLYVKPH